MFARKHDAKVVIISGAIGLLVGSILPSQFNPIVKLRAALATATKKGV